jgi:tetratricopeptide (TPR) repeat protein
MTNSHGKKGSKRLILIGAAALIVLLAAGGIWWYVSFRSTPQSTSVDQSANTSVDSVVEARSLLDEGRADEAVKMYDADIKSAGSSDEKVSARIAKSDFLIEAEKSAEAYDVATATVAEYKDSALAYAALARAQAATGRKAEAVASYERAITLLGDTGTTGRIDPKAYYRARIEELK